MATAKPTLEAPRTIAQALDRTTRGERVTVTRKGEAVAALVSLADLALLEELEDRRDAQDADRALDEFEASGEAPIPWEKVKARLAL